MNGCVSNTDLNTITVFHLFGSYIMRTILNTILFSEYIATSTHLSFALANNLRYIAN